MGSSSEGCGYDGFGLGIEVCVNGAVGNGETALLEVFTNSSSLASEKKIGEKTGWDGSIVNFPNWHDSMSAAGCDNIISSNVRIQKSNKNDDVVLITVRVELDGCDMYSNVYDRCGGEGPHVLETSRTVNMTSAPGCSDGAIVL